MKKRLLVVLIAAMAVASLWLAGYILLGGRFPMKDPATVYHTAIADETLKEDLILTVTQTKEITTKEETYLLKSYQTIRYDTDKENSVRIHKQETLQIGSHQVSINEAFIGQELYTTIDDVKFISNTLEDTYKNQCFAPVIIDKDLYKNVTGSRNLRNYRITFSEPTAPEQWITDVTSDTYSAEGTAFIDQHGRLTESNYSASYAIYDVQYRITINVTITRQNVDIPLPNKEEYTEISNAEPLHQLEIACGYLMQAENISSQYTDTIYLQATGDRRSQSISARSSFNDTWTANIETEITLSNESRGSHTTTQKKTETYADGKYAMQSSDTSASQDIQITENEMRNYLHNHLVSTIMLPQYIDDISIIETNDLITFTFTGNQEFAEFLAENACNILYKDPELIKKTAEGFKTNTFDCYLTVSRSTGLATSSGIKLSAEYCTSGLPYLFEYQAEQLYHSGK